MSLAWSAAYSGGLPVEAVEVSRRAGRSFAKPSSSAGSGSGGGGWEVVSSEMPAGTFT